MEAAQLRREFPVLARLAYLNAGTSGPVPARGLRAAEERARLELERGRSGAAHHEQLYRMSGAVRSLLASPLGCEPGEIALTHSTTEGVNVVLSALALRAGDEILTTDEEHPGLLAPLAATARRSGISVRVVPFAEVAGEVRATTRLVACSHVSWVSGRVVDAPALAASPAPVLLDGAQGLGALPTDVAALGCDFYAASGQKWLCGPSGTGCLYLRSDLIDELAPAWPGYESLADPGRPSDLKLHPDARRFDRGPVVGPLAAWWRAALELLEEAGWTSLHRRGSELAERLVSRLREGGLQTAPRGRSTLVSWRDPDASATVERLARDGILVRDIPGRGLVRASVGAWSSTEEVDRLAELAVRAGD